MRLLWILAVVLLAVGAGPSTAKRAGSATGIVRVRFETSDGPIVLALEARRAPKTVANFLAYVDDGRFDGVSFYRSARRRADPRFGFIQGGIQTDARRILPTFAHEPTSKTGILHTDGTISMARRLEPGSAGGNFFICVGAIPSMDAKGDFIGYAAFGHVISGMSTVKRILAENTGGGSEVMRGQMLVRPVRLLRAVRLDGTPKPTDRPRAWLMKVPK
ncbi:MAG: peptidylprolyl isomerase [Sphingomonas sp.]